MSDTVTTNTSTTDGEDTSGTTSTAGDEFKPITSQDELNRLIGERVRRAKPADYDELKAKASQFDELTEAQKTELQKATDRAVAAESKAAQVEARALRAEVASAKGIPAGLLSGSTKEELEASADALLAFRGPSTRSATAEVAGAGKQGDDIIAPKQLTRDDLKSMSASQIMAAQKAGQLKTLTQGS